MEGGLSRDALSLWIAPLKPLLFADAKLVIEAPAKIHERIVRERYMDLMRRCARVLKGREIQIDFVTASQPFHAASLPLPREEKKASPRAVKLNHRYTFENFIVGKCNRAAYSSALAVAGGKGRSCNPLFLSGSVGLGKTHLLQAIGARTGAGSGSSLVCVPSERLMDNLAEAVENRTISALRRRIAAAGLLLVDDVHFLSGRNQMQEEFFRIFTALSGGKIRIVLTSDRHPRDIPRLHERLVSRFESGAVVELSTPSLATRIAILSHKTGEFDLRLPREILVLIASRIRTNIRSMEGVLNRIAAHTALTGEDPGRELVETILADRHFDCGEGPLTVRSIQKRVASHFNIKLGALVGESRKETVVLPRQIAMYLCRKLIGLPYADIGAAFSGRDHTTALHSCKAMEQLWRESSELKELVSELVTVIRS